MTNEKTTGSPVLRDHVAGRWGGSRAEKVGEERRLSTVSAGAGGVVAVIVYNKVLFLSICSLHKKKDGTSEYAGQESIASRLSPALTISLLKKQEKVRNLIWSGDVSRGSIDTVELEHNNNLAPGADFGGNAEWAEYLPAISRYSGDFTLLWEQREKED